jgi:hypothetical protein
VKPLNQTKIVIALLIAVGLVVSSVLVADGMATKANTDTSASDQINSLNSQINDLIQQEVVVNETGYNQVKDSGWANYYHTVNELTSLGVTNNATLQNQMDDLQNQVLALQSQLATAQTDAKAQSEAATTTGNNLIIAGSIGFVIVGLSVVIGYAAHKHMVTLISKSQKAPT